jgi:hypothetical protein
MFEMMKQEQTKEDENDGYESYRQTMAKRQHQFFLLHRGRKGASSRKALPRREASQTTASGEYSQRRKP